jgi:hypothetical protein
MDYNIILPVDLPIVCISNLKQLLTMLKHAAPYLTLFMSLGFLCKCNDMPEPRHVNRTIAPDFVREVPIIKEGKYIGHNDSFYESLNKDAFALQLDSLEAGYDSLQFRIWLGHSMAKVKHVVILKFKDHKWKGQLVSFSNETENNDLSKKVRKVYPGSGWDTLIDSLYKLKIISLPHETELAGYSGTGGTDGISYDFEIATSKRYRAYSYKNPEYNTNFWQAKNVLQIANLLEKEFDFQYVK